MKKYAYVEFNPTLVKTRGRGTGISDAVERDHDAVHVGQEW